jgi:hypothetical protein
VKAEDGGEVGDGVFGGGSGSAQVAYGVVIAVSLQHFLKVVRIGLAVGKTVAGGDAVAIADQQRLGGAGERQGQKQERQCNKEGAANVHGYSVAGKLGGTKEPRGAYL